MLGARGGGLLRNLTIIFSEIVLGFQHTLWSEAQRVARVTGMQLVAARLITPVCA